MVDSILDNLSLRTQRKGELRLDIGLTTPATALEQLIADIKKILERNEIENSTVLLNDITPSAFQLLVDYFTGPVTQQEFNSIKQQINFAILKRLEESNIEIAGASTDVKIIGKTE
jgi:MscS family membrane protein